MMDVVNVNTSSDPKGSSVNGLEESASNVMFFIRDEVTNKVGATVRPAAPSRTHHKTVSLPKRASPRSWMFFVVCTGMF